MALKQRQLAECAEEALNAQRAYDELRAACEESLAKGSLALLAFVLADQPVMSAPRSEAALEHIGRTSKRNERRARRAREERAKRSEK